MLSTVVFSLCAVVVYQQVQGQQAVTFSNGALLNVIAQSIEGHNLTISIGVAQHQQKHRSPAGQG